MTKKELIMTTIEKMGYRPETDEDGDVTFRYQMKHIFVMIGDEEDPYVTVTLPQFYEIKDGEEPLVLAVCNKMTCRIKLLKVFVDNTYKNVTAECDFYYTDEASLEQNMDHSLRLLGIARTLFKQYKDDMSEE